MCARVCFSLSIHAIARVQSEVKDLLYSLDNEVCVCLFLQLGEVLFEERVYPAGKWACITKGEKLYEQSISMGFMKLMKFICKENSVGKALVFMLLCNY